MQALRFASLGSGSRGNATLIEKNDTTVLLDCGFSVSQTEKRLQRLAKSPQALDAIILTHEHSDHAAGACALATKYNIPLWMTHGCRRALEPDINVHEIDSHNPFHIKDIEIIPFPVPHDAKEPVQFVFSDGISRLGILTDTGMITPHITKQLNGCDALILEANHDPEMLYNGHYPQALKQRVGGNQGHLSNAQAAALLSAIDTSNLQYLIAAHLSEKNNTPELALHALSEALGCNQDWIILADQKTGFGWHEIKPTVAELRTGT